MITAVIDGHGDDYNETFISIEDCARKLIEYINEHHAGRIFALCGLSLGAQIVLEALSQKADVTQNAIIESALVLPMRSVELLANPSYTLFYRLIKQRWFSKAQAKELLIPENMFEDYFCNVRKMSKHSLVNIAKSNAAYSIKNTLNKAECSALILVGSKEKSMMLNSAEKIHSVLKSSEMCILSNMKHGEFSICNPKQYTNLFLSHFA